MPFKALQLSAPVLRGVVAAGYTDPTPIQLRAIPVVLGGGDLIGSAQTGTGKTAAFALPILTRLGAHAARAPRVLVLEPTRELAAQVETAFRDFARFTDLRTVAVFGGVGYGLQRTELKRGVDVIVATPGRLMDYLHDRTINLQGVEILVLDEVDRMLDMGFLPVVKDIIQRCPRQRQTLFFSATVPPEIQAVASFALRNPTRVEVGVNRSVNESVKHALYPVAADQKFELLEALLARTDFDSVLVFSRTKHGADKIARKLKAANHSVAVLHANRSQNQRIEALAGFKSGKYEIMVATDIAARGIDVAGVSHVINYDVPEKPEDYVHRIGRTGRAQAVGDAFTLVTPENAHDVRDIERFIGQKIPELRLAGFSYRPFVARPPQVQPPRPPGSLPGQIRHKGSFNRYRGRR
ncbi:DEAD/DEAH box helicase [Opitutus terrae]|uniref:DEAD/DEAH box helicase domain protein n=1 Tax=Opitutus terrae (strain DSM 11246 / JCM 15787 / PB90-1) TaxID=452637 RepID=B1ZWV2_OPITP|nr:DEAD/DEAH box helicase [Opitutus terrae]ACB74231.1 DEAD/DEAH box helicase domain protein [Opitutus terrae PB90-1]